VFGVGVTTSVARSVLHSRSCVLGVLKSIALTCAQCLTLKEASDGEKMSLSLRSVQTAADLRRCAVFSVSVRK
jgi:hypothetical protein